MRDQHRDRMRARKCKRWSVGRGGRMSTDKQSECRRNRSATHQESNPDRCPYHEGKGRLQVLRKRGELLCDFGKASNTSLSANTSASAVSKGVALCNG